jgi:hypothetical protein
LRNNGIDREDDKGKESSGPDENPDNIAQDEPRNKSAPIVNIPRSYASYREPLEANLQP